METEIRGAGRPEDRTVEDDRMVCPPGKPETVQKRHLQRVMTNLDVDSIICRIKECLPGDSPSGMVALHEPSFCGNEWNYVKECLDTGWVSSVGKFVDRFEEELAAYVGVKRAVAVVIGTAALHIALKLVGVERDD